MALIFKNFLPLLLLTCLLSYIELISSKVTIGTTRLDSETTEVELGHFSFSSHLQGTIDGIITFPKDGLSYYRTRSNQLMISVFDDATWLEYKRLIKRGSLCRNRVHVGKTYRLQLPQNSDVVTFKHEVKQSATMLESYVVLSDCMLEEYNANPPSLDYKLTFLNGTEHLPQDELHMPTLLYCLLIPIFAAILVYLYKMKQQHTKSSQVHLIQILIGVSFILVTFSIIMQLCHLRQYSLDGRGLKLRYTWFACDFLSEISEVFSEIIIAFVFIAITLFGWLFSASSSKMTTILQKKHIPFFILYGITHLWLQYLSRRHEADFNYFFYDIQHWAGFAIILLRIGSLLLFILGLAISTSVIGSFIRLIPPLAQFLIKAGILTNLQVETAKVENGEKIGFLSQNQDSQINTVFIHLAIIGCIWFLVLPTSIIFSFIFNPTNRRLVVVGLSLSVHILTLIWFIFAFTFESLYYKASCLGNMGTVFSNTQATGYWSSKIALD